MKIDAIPPSRPLPARKTGSPTAPKQPAPRPDDSYHSPDEIRVDIVLPPDPDSHDAPDNPQAADGDLLNREAAIETAQALGAWLARHTRSLTSHHAARLQHLFIG